MLEDIVKEYVRSEITVVFLYDKVRKQYINIFSVAEMCPVEQEASENMHSEKEDKLYPTKCLPIDKNREIHIARIFSENPLDSVNFFRGINNKRTICIDKEQVNIISECSNLIQDPQNEIPLLIAEDSCKNSSINDVLPKRNLPMRVCSFFDVEEKTRNLFTNNEIIKINGFVSENLGVDIIKFSEYIGSIILCFSNPILRDISMKIAKSEKQLIVHMFEREGKKFSDGTIELTDERINGIGFSIEEHINKQLFMINIPYFPEKLRVKIFDDNHNLIYESLGTFIKNINIEFGIMGKRKFLMHDKSGLSKNIEVDTVTYDTLNSINKEETSVQNELSLKNKNRELEQLESDKVFIFFEGNTSTSKDKAKIVVRELISKAKSQCIICDPYFSASDFMDFGIYVTSDNMTLQLLSSAFFLKEKIEETSNITYGNQLNDVIVQVKNRSSNGMKVKCHVLAGRKKSPLHDRFIVIDNDVYILGSSLNEFGTRATTLFKVPNPKPLIRQANNWFDNPEYSKPLEEWVSKSKGRK